MRTCNNCKKTFNDDMSFCPYCGEKYHDYKEDLKKEMDSLFDDVMPQEEVKEVQSEQTSTTPSRVQKHTQLREEKENDVLNKVLISVIALIVVVLLGGIIFFGKDLLPTTPVDEPVPGDVIQDEENDEKPVVDNKEDEEVVIDNKENEDNQPNETVEGNIGVTNEENGDFLIHALKVKKENNQIRIDIDCTAEKKGNLYLKDEGSLNVGPIEVDKGTNSFYFQVSENGQYIILFETANKNYEYKITSDMLKEALN